MSEREAIIAALAALEAHIQAVEWLRANWRPAIDADALVLSGLAVSLAPQAVRDVLFRPTP